MFLVKLIAALAYISLGLPDAMLGVAWPNLRRSVDVPIDYLGFLLGATFTGYLLSSSFAHQVARRMGIGWLLVLSSSAMTVVLVGFAISSHFAIIVGLGFIGGLGGGAIDASLNSFTAHRFSIRMVNWLHGCWGIGAFCGPMLMTLILVQGYSWRVGYLSLSVLLGFTALLMLLTRRHWSYADQDEGHQGHSAKTRDVILDRQVLGQCGLFFLYAGIESTVGQLLYTLWTEGRSVSPGIAGAAVTSYWIAFTASRFAIGQLSTQWTGQRILRTSAYVSPILAAMIAFPVVEYLDFIAVAILGAFIAPIFPTWIGMTPQTVEPRFASQAIGFQVSAAAIGIAVLPGAILLVARRVGLEVIPISLVGFITVMSVAQTYLLRASPDQVKHHP